MSKPSFELKKPTSNALFMPTTETIVNGNGEKIIYVSVNKLKHYRKHPFRLYEGERFNDMVESIRDYGILSPLIVIPLPPNEADGQYEYEVFIGHNRLECGKIAGLEEVPCIVREGLTDAEISVFVRISNLLQRGFSDLPHSERAEALAIYYNSIKQQGRRTDLIKEVEALLNVDVADNLEAVHDSEDETSTPAGNKSIEVAGEKYGLSRNSVARYIRLNDLIPELKEYLDSEELSIRAGVSLSYLSEKRQRVVLHNMEKWQKSPTMKQADEIKRLNAEYTADTVMGDEAFPLHCTDLFLELNAYAKEQKPKKTINFKLDRSTVQSYFKEDATEEAIQETVLEALQFYHQHREQFYGSQEQQ